jgi:glucose/arabinose dehydrogenase
MVCLWLLSACSHAAPVAVEDEAGKASEPDAKTSVADLVGLEPVFDGTVFERPVDVGPYPGHQLYVATQDGRIVVGAPDAQPDHLLADLTQTVGTEAGGEQGLLSVALDPAFETNGYLYVYYAPANEPLTRLSRLTVLDGVADPVSEQVVLEIEQLYTNHNGGTVLFGQDGMLYLSVGDGGGPSDPVVNRRSQDTQSLFGTVVRLDVRDSSPEEPYRIPSDNPFVDDPDTLSEIWAYGFRNPWRMTVDRLTGALWVGDVGENRFEEVNVVSPGGNYGWNDLEGDSCFPEGAACEPDPAMVPPVLTYTHEDGCSISGAVVYRGGDPLLAGRFLYGDFCNGSIWGMDVDSRDTLRLAGTGHTVISIGEDEDGEAYVLAFDSPVLRVTSAGGE